MTTIRSEKLANGLEITFHDRSNRYFGDYHRICLVVEISCGLQDVSGRVDPGLLDQARRHYGERLTVEQRIERMGVPSADLDKVRHDLVDHFMNHSAAYLSRPDYPGLLLAAELRKLQKRRYHV